MTPSNELRKELQQLMHRYGLEAFKVDLVQAAFNASEDTEVLEDKSLSEDYQDFASRLSEEFGQ